MPIVSGVATSEDSWGRFGGGHFCAASRPRGVRGVDLGTEKHPLGRVLFGRSAGILTLRRGPRRAVVRPSLDILCLGALNENRHGEPSGRIAGDILVATGTLVVA